MNKFLLMFCYIWAGIVVILNLLVIAGMALFKEVTGAEGTIREEL